MQPTDGVSTAGVVGLVHLVTPLNCSASSAQRKPSELCFKTSLAVSTLELGVCLQVGIVAQCDSRDFQAH